MLQGLLVFVIFLGPLIFFHELGHFLFARLCGVRVETFSIGFGPKILKFRRGDTDYAISIIPLGGYVKMYGDDPTGKDEVPEDQRQYAFTHKTKMQKFWIVFGGPLANFILAYVIYYFLLIAGETVPQVKFGVVEQNTSFYSAGLRTGDILKKVNSDEVSSLEDLASVDEKITSVIVNRGGKNVELTTDFFSKTFIETFVGLEQFFRQPIFINAKGEEFYISTTEKKNLKVSIEEIASAQPEVLYLINAKNEKQFQKLELGSQKLLPFLRSKNLYPVDIVVDGLIVDDPADKAKIKKGDILIGINGKEIHSFNFLRNHIQDEARRLNPIKLEYLRAGQKFTTKLVPNKKKVQDQTFYTIGVYSGAKIVERQMVEGKPRGFGESFGLALQKTWVGSVSVLSGFKKLVTGAVSVKNLGGPIMIAKQASYSLDISLSYFFKMMAIISINLGILNLLPIPVLDGGHILFLIIETFTGGPIPEKILLVAQQLGLSILLLLMIFAVGNDIVRVFN